MDDLREAIRAQFALTHAIPIPILQEVLDTAAPIQIVLSVTSAEFGPSVPIKLQARVFVTGLGQGLPQVPLSFAVNGKAVASNVLTDKNGQAVFSTKISQPGAYSLQVFTGPVDPNNPAVKSLSLTVTKVTVDSPINVGFTAEGANFKTPATLLFPFFTGGPSYYALNFTPLVNLGKNSAWLLTGPSQIAVDTTTGDVFLPYVLPNPAIRGPEKVNADQPFALTGTLVDQNSNPLQNLALTLNLDGNDIQTSYTDASGIAQFGNISLREGSHQARVSWLGLNLSSLLSILATILPPPPIATLQLSFVHGYTTPTRNIGGDLVGGDYRATGPMPNSPISVTVYPINRNTRSPAYIAKEPVLLPASFSGQTDANGNFSFALLKDDPGILMGWYAIGTVATCCQAQEWHDQYQGKIVWNGVTYDFTFSPTGGGSRQVSVNTGS